MFAIDTFAWAVLILAVYHYDLFPEKLKRFKSRHLSMMGRTPP